MSAPSRVLAVLVLAVCTVSVSTLAVAGALSNGVCLCVNEPNVDAYRDPSDPGSSLVTLSNGDCFITNGGIYHKDGNTWYELRDTQNKQIAWVDSFYLNVHLMTNCNSSAPRGKASFHVPSGQALSCIVYGKTYSHGDHFQMHGLHCTCDDGYSACSASGPNCFDDGIVYREGVNFHKAGSGACTCNQGAVSCSAPVG